MKPLPEWGSMLCLDLHECNPYTIRNRVKIEFFVRDLCKLIKMKPFGSTVITRFGKDPKITGFSMIQFIESSLISGHFAEFSNAAYIDIFSCKQFSQKKATKFSLEYFEAKFHNSHWISRR